jgi:hypothetical protein
MLRAEISFLTGSQSGVGGGRVKATQILTSSSLWNWSTRAPSRSPRPTTASRRAPPTSGGSFTNAIRGRRRSTTGTCGESRTGGKSCAKRNCRQEMQRFSRTWRSSPSSSTQGPWSSLPYPPRPFASPSLPPSLLPFISLLSTPSPLPSNL